MKSIFRQREVEKLYEMVAIGGLFVPDLAVRAKGNQNNVISEKEIGEYDIEIPMLEKGDKFFLHNLQEVVVIKSRMRSSDGCIIYYVEDKIVETENTKKSYEESMEKLEHWKCERRRLEKLEKEFKEYKKEYKYKNRFFNKKIDD